ncbi:MAG TPA: SCO family protein [Candidatus Baltobacteraceae bacterium]|jgi:protein SCO1/2
MSLTFARIAWTTALCSALVGCGHSIGRDAPHGTVLNPPRPAATFDLPATTGGTFDLAASKGHLVVLYFGFTHCADTCPQTLAHINAALKDARLTEARAVFVTIDPRRDTIAAERAFFAKAAVRAIGVTGTRAQLAPIWKAYGVSVQPQPTDIAHSDYIYAIDAAGRLREVLHADVPVVALAADLRALARVQ